MFLWSYVAHDLIPIAFAGIREIPREKEVTAALNDLIGDNPGTYMFPWVGPDAGRRQEKQKAMADYAKHPSGLLVYHSPDSRPFNFPKFLGVEFIVELVESYLAVFLLAQTRHVSMGARACLSACSESPSPSGRTCPIGTGMASQGATPGPIFALRLSPSFWPASSSRSC